MRQNGVTAMLQERRSRDNMPVVEVLDYALCGGNTAKVTARVVHNRFSQSNHDLVRQSMLGMFDNKLAPVHGSFISVSKEPLSEIIVGHVRVNTDIVALTDDNRDEFKSLSSNIFADGEDKLWTLKHSASGELLVRNTGIDDEAALRDMLDAHTAISGMSLSHDVTNRLERRSSTLAQAQGGDFIDFVSADSGRVEAGFVVAEAHDNLVVLSVSGNSEEIHPESVLDIHDTEEFPEPSFTEQERVNHAVSAARGNTTLERLLEYYALVYRRSASFYKQFADRARAHAFM